MVLPDCIVKWTAVERRYNTPDAFGLKSTNLLIHAGETVAIVGPSGAGKSTALNVMGLMDQPSAGFYELLGQDTSAMRERDRARLRSRSLGFIFQSFHLMMRRSVVDNVILGLLYGPVQRQTWFERAMSALEGVGLADRANEPCDRLSGGERQRVAIARAAVARPRLLLADEPTGNLDSATGNAVLEMILNHRPDDGAQVIVTHDMRVAERCDRTLLIVDGVLSETVGDGSPHA